MPVDEAARVTQAPFINRIVPIVDNMRLKIALHPFHRRGKRFLVDNLSHILVKLVNAFFKFSRIGFIIAAFENRDTVLLF